MTLNTLLCYMVYILQDFRIRSGLNNETGSKNMKEGSMIQLCILTEVFVEINLECNQMDVRMMELIARLPVKLDK